MEVYLSGGAKGIDSARRFIPRVSVFSVLRFTFDVTVHMSGGATGA